MRKPLLPIRLNEKACVGGQSEALQVYLKGVGDEHVAQRLGSEKITGPTEPVHTRAGTLFVLRTLGEKFKGPTEVVQGGRILLVDPADPQGLGPGVVAAVNWTKIGSDVVASNICVRPEFRRKGLGSLLIECARQEFPKIKADRNMTITGALFMGYIDDVLANNSLQPPEDERLNVRKEAFSPKNRPVENDAFDFDSLEDGPDYAIDVSADGGTVWVCGKDGSNLGRFSKKFGLDVHRPVTEQMAGKAQCLHCTHEPAGPVQWEEFRSQVRTHFGIEVPADTIEFDNEKNFKSKKRFSP